MESDVRLRCLDPALIFAILAFALIAGARALRIPLFATGDELGHLDYAYQVWLGRLPDFFEGTLIYTQRGSNIPVQWVSQHPPLFYLLIAPIIGPLVASGRLLMAGLAGRAVNIIIGAAAIPVAYALGARMAGKRSVARVAAFLVASCPWLYGVSAAVYNDALAVLVGGLVALACVHLLHKPAGVVPAVFFILVSSAAMLTRLNLLAVVAPALFILFTSAWRRQGSQRLALLFASLGAGVGILASSGWFYLRNLRSSGSITGGHPEWSAENLGRAEVPLTDLATSRDFWNLYTALFDPAPAKESFVGPLLLLVPMGLALIALVWRILRQRMRWVDSETALMVCGVLAAASAMQLVFASGGGAVNPRYLLPTLVVLAVLMAFGIAAAHRWLLAPWCVVWGLVVIPWWMNLPRDVDTAASMPIYTAVSDVLFYAGCGALIATLGVVLLKTKAPQL